MRELRIKNHEGITTTTEFPTLAAAVREVEAQLTADPEVRRANIKTAANNLRRHGYEYLITRDHRHIEITIR